MIIILCVYIYGYKKKKLKYALKICEIRVHTPQICITMSDFFYSLSGQMTHITCIECQSPNNAVNAINAVFTNNNTNLVQHVGDYHTYMQLHSPGSCAGRLYGLRRHRGWFRRTEQIDVRAFTVDGHELLVRFCRRYHGHFAFSDARRRYLVGWKKNRKFNKPWYEHR